MLKPYYTLLPLLGFLLFGCARAPAPDVLELMLPDASEFGVQRIEHKSVLVPDQRGVGAQSAQDMAVFKASQIESSAYFKYWLNERQAYKVRINVYTDKPAREAGWLKRYPPATLQATRSLGLGEVSFLQGDKIGAFAIQQALVEISSSKGADQLEAFMRAYAAHVEAQY